MRDVTLHDCMQWLPRLANIWRDASDDADSIHGSIEQRITDFPLGFEGQWVARMGAPMNTVRCLGLSPTFAASGAHDPPDSVLKGFVQPLFQKNGLF